ncbi:MAG TPA: efflux transporter outer membrane subunit [Steroidobacteraceae bacterium]|nr:efflux transporter outer membrane subunit [Steroidobacteraceae bacterium]
MMTKSSGTIWGAGMAPRNRLRGWLLAGMSACLAACAVGPDYKRPPVAAADGFKEVGGWKPTEPADALARGPWWHIFNDATLSQLEDQVDISNQNVKSAAAAVEQARALVSEAQAGFWPTITASIGRSRSRNGAAPSHNTNSAGGSVSWPLDIWGEVRRSVESNEATAESNEALLASARLSAQAQLALDYFELRGQDQLQVLLDDTVKAYQQALQITENRYRAGVAARADVVTAQTQLLSAQAQQVAVAIQRGIYEHAIAVLVGQQPATFSVAPVAIRTDVPTVPSGVPSGLLERRPDIASAERKVAAANAQIGVAKSAYFPSLSLTGSAQYESGGPLSQLFRVPNQIWSVGPSLAETLFAGGLHRAQVAAARAAWEGTVDDYRQTVLQGFQQVEDELVTLRVLEQQALVEDKLVAAAREAEKLTLNQYKAGTVPYSSVITAQTTRLASEQSALTVFVDRLVASVTLIEALGGGWSTSQLPP